MKAQQDYQRVFFNQIVSIDGTQIDRSASEWQLSSDQKEHLILQADYYSLAFFAFFINQDEETIQDNIEENQVKDMLKSMKIELPETIPLNTVSDRKQKQMLRESRNHLQYLKDESRITVNTQAIFANAYKEKVKLEKNMRIQRNNQILTNISMLFIL